MSDRVRGIDTQVSNDTNSMDSRNVEHLQIARHACNTNSTYAHTHSSILRASTAIPVTTVVYAGGPSELLLLLLLLLFVLSDVAAAVVADAVTGVCCIASIFRVNRW